MDNRSAFGPRFFIRALRMPAAVILLAVVGGACTEEPKLGGFGEACNDPVQCRGDALCPEDILQCTTACSGDADCASPDTMTCYEGHCYLKCDSFVDPATVSGDAGEPPSDCPHGAVCNNLLWCGRSRTVKSSGGAGGAGGSGGSGGGAAGSGGSPGGSGGSADAAAGAGGAADASAPADGG
jgi:uncharacterized membrane protein YgcG